MTVTATNTKTGPLTTLQRGRHVARAICFLLAFIITNQAFGQTKIITGRVLDSATRAPLQNVSIKVKGGGGKLTDSSGYFRLEVDKSTRQIQVSFVGYTPRTIQVTETPQHLTILLAEALTELEGVTVKMQHRKYRNKNNPAVELIREVIQHRDENSINSYPFAAFRTYNKTELSVDNLPRWIPNSKLIQRYRFLFENIDTVKVPGKRLLPFYISETFTQQYYRQHPEQTKTIVLGQKSVDYGEFIDLKSIYSVLITLYKGVDVYKDRTDLFGTQLLSPITATAPTFYMYFIMDTTLVNGVPTVKLAFLPRNPDDLLFRGTLYVPLDEHYAVSRAELNVSKHINLNFVRSLKVDIDYKKDSLGHYYLATSDMVSDFGLFDKGFGMYGERLISNTGFTTGGNAPDSLFNGAPEDSAAGASHPPESLWATARSVPLSAIEVKTYHNIDSVRGMHSYHNLMDVGTMLWVGYKQAGVFNIGPIGTFLSYNPIEGLRPQFGGRTTPKLSKTIYGETFAAFGLTDRLWKYGVNLTYSINHHNIFTYFPLHYLQAGFTRDTRIPGQINSFSTGNSFLNSFTLGPNDQWLYNNLFHIDYLREYKSHFSYDIGFQYWLQQPAGSLQYLYPQGNQFDTVHNLTASTFSLTLRWAPHEQFIQNQLGRADIATHYPIITANYVRGIKGLAGGQFNYDALHLNIYQRLFLAPIGFTDVTVDAAYLTGQLPFPMLYIHPANETFVYYYNSYNLMNYEEFVSDHYASLFVDHYFNGFFFNKIPLLKWLKWREVVEAKVLYGGVRNENNPYVNPAQMKFPTMNGVTSTYVLNGKPYVEAGFGVFNIFKILRVDVVKRFTYLNNPNINTWTFKFGTLVNF